jgi:hypothetical protein
MPIVGISTTGTEKLVRLAAAIKAAGGKELQRELEKAARRAGRPLVRSARQGAIAILPYRGGLGESVAASRFSAQVRATPQGVGLQIVAVGRRGRNLSRQDDGIVRHPVFADAAKTRSEWTWVDQKITPGWFSKPLTLDAPKQKKEFDEAVDIVATRLEAAGG